MSPRPRLDAVTPGRDGTSRSRLSHDGDHLALSRPACGNAAEKPSSDSRPTNPCGTRSASLADEPVHLLRATPEPAGQLETAGEDAAAAAHHDGARLGLIPRPPGPRTRLLRVRIDLSPGMASDRDLCRVDREGDGRPPRLLAVRSGRHLLDRHRGGRRVPGDVFHGLEAEDGDEARRRQLIDVTAEAPDLLDDYFHGPTDL